MVSLRSRISLVRCLEGHEVEVNTTIATDGMNEKGLTVATRVQYISRLVIDRHAHGDEAKLTCIAMACT